MLNIMELERLKQNLEIIVPEGGLEEKLAWSHKNQVPLRIKMGFDPTAPDLHLGHAVALKIMKQFQDHGHKVVVIIGDFTARIGDPTGRNKMRPPLSQEEIKANAETYLAQLNKILDVDLAEIRWNSEWLSGMHLDDTLGLMSLVTLSQLLQREDFHTRYKNQVPIHFHEFLYPIMQGYDSLRIDADIEMGGRDQLFNCLMGRDIQSAHQKTPQIVACVPILRGTDGHHKMSKSLNNYIGLTEDPQNMYGKVMSIPDALIEEYVRLVSTFSEEQRASLTEDIKHNPMEVKKELAYDIVKQFHGVSAAEDSRIYFYKQVQSRDDSLIEFIPVALSSIGLELNGLTLLTLCFCLLKDKSKGDVRRLIQGGGVTINSEKVLDPALEIGKLVSGTFKIKVGKRGFYTIYEK